MVKRKRITIVKRTIKIANDEERYDIARYYHTLGFTDEALSITEDLRLLYPEESEFTVFLAELYIDQTKKMKRLKCFMIFQKMMIYMFNRYY